MSGIDAYSTDVNLSEQAANEELAHSTSSTMRNTGADKSNIGASATISAPVTPWTTDKDASIRQVSIAQGYVHNQHTKEETTNCATTLLLFAGTVSSTGTSTTQKGISLGPPSPVKKQRRSRITRKRDNTFGPPTFVAGCAAILAHQISPHGHRGGLALSRYNHGLLRSIQYQLNPNVAGSVVICELPWHCEATINAIRAHNAQLPRILRLNENVVVLVAHPSMYHNREARFALPYFFMTANAWRQKMMQPKTAARVRDLTNKLDAVVDCRNAAYVNILMEIGKVIIDAESNLLHLPIFTDKQHPFRLTFTRKERLHDVLHRLLHSTTNRQAPAMNMFVVGGKHAATAYVYTFRKFLINFEAPFIGVRNAEVTRKHEQTVRVLNTSVLTLARSVRDEGPDALACLPGKPNLINFLNCVYNAFFDGAPEPAHWAISLALGNPSWPISHIYDYGSQMVELEEKSRPNDASMDVSS